MRPKKRLFKQKNGRRTAARLAALLLAALGLFPSAKGEERPLKLMITADLHYLSPALYAQDREALESAMKTADGKMTQYSGELLEALVREALSLAPDALIVAGDLSFNGEKRSHLELAAAFEGLRAAGIPVYVIPGNHDINSLNAGGFLEGRFQRVPNVSPGEFREIYRDFLGPEDPGEAQMSRVVPLSEKVWLALCDVSVYEPFPEAGGAYTGGTDAWLREVLAEAKAAGAKVITVTHQSLIPHTDLMRSSMTVAEGALMAQRMREAGNAPLNLSGHLHLQHISEEGGITDIATGAFSVPPFRYGILTAAGDGTLEYRAAALPRTRLPEEMALLADTWFESTAKEKTRPRLSALGVPEEALEGMLDYAARLNHAYFSGEFVSTDPKWTLDPAFKLWEALGDRDATARYLTALPGSPENARSALDWRLPGE